MKIDKTIPQIHHWIDDTVVIDFELTQRLKDLIEKLNSLMKMNIGDISIM